MANKKKWILAHYACNCEEAGNASLGSMGVVLLSEEEFKAPSEECQYCELPLLVYKDDSEYAINEILKKPGITKEFLRDQGYQVE